MHLLLLCLDLVLLSAGFSTILTPNEALICPDSDVTFRCVVMGTDTLRWAVNFIGNLSNIDRVIFFSTDQEGTTWPVSIGGGHQITFTLISNSPLTSTMETTSTHELHGATVSCHDGVSTNAATDTRILHLITRPQAVQQLVTVLNDLNQRSNYIDITIIWTASSMSDRYIIEIFPPFVEFGSTFTTPNTTIQLPVLHNQEYNISVVASNCAGNSTPTVATVNISWCTPPLIGSDINVRVEGYISASQIIYSCQPGLVPSEIMMANCTGNGNWNPDPSELRCRAAANCGTLNNFTDIQVMYDYNSTTTEGAVITFNCAEGLTPNQTVTSVCTSEGLWNPDPFKHRCISVIIGNKNNSISNHIITVISTVTAFVFGLLCGLLLYQCFRILATSHKEKNQTRNPIYEDVFPQSAAGGQMISTEFELAANVAYGPV